jgi:hypothetical protein
MLQLSGCKRQDDRVSKESAKPELALPGGVGEATLTVLEFNMKAAALLTNLVCLVTFPGDAFATKIGVNGRTTMSHEHASCHMLYERCRPSHSEAQCKILYDAAIKEGGSWSSTAAQAAAKIDLTKADIATKNMYCHID